MTSAWSQLEQMLTCAICLDKFKNPKLLPCQHSFCGDACMEGLVDYARRQIKCPECRAEHRIPYQGVQSLPANVTLIRFLELHSRITGEEPEPVPTFMEKCSVCGEKVEGVQRCAHCEKKVCPECKEAHVDLLRREINRVNGQTRRCFGKMQEFKETLDKAQERLQINHASVRNEIEESCRRLIEDLQSKQKSMVDQVNSYAEAEQKTIDKLRAAIDDELSVLESNTQLADDKLVSNKYAWTDAELNELKEIYVRAMEFVRLFDPEIGDYTRKIRFMLIPEFETLRRRLCELGELKFGESACAAIASALQYCNAQGQVAAELCASAQAQACAQQAQQMGSGGYGLAHSNSNSQLSGLSSSLYGSGGGGGGAGSTMLELPSMQNALMRSQSDHRLASQFQQMRKQQQQHQQQLDKSSAFKDRYGQSAAAAAATRGTDYETESLRSRYAPPRSKNSDLFGSGGNATSNDLLRDWPRPSDNDAGDLPFASTIQFKSAFMRRKEKERASAGYSAASSTLGIGDDDDDLQSEASYGGLGATGGRAVRFSSDAGQDGAAQMMRALAKVFDTKEAERAPLSGVPKLGDSMHLNARLHQMAAKSVVDKKQAEEDSKRDHELFESARESMNKIAQRGRQQSEADEIEKQKRANKTFETSSPASETRRSPSPPAPPPVQQPAATATTPAATDAQQSPSTSQPSTPTSVGNRRGLYGQAVNERSRRQLSNAIQEAATYTTRRRTLGASSSIDSDATPTHSGGGTPAADAATESPVTTTTTRRALRNRSMSKQSSVSGEQSGGESSTSAVSRTRRRMLTRNQSSTSDTATSSSTQPKNSTQGSGGLASGNTGTDQYESPSEQYSGSASSRLHAASTTSSGRTSPPKRSPLSFDRDTSSRYNSGAGNRTSTTTDDSDDNDEQQQQQQQHDKHTRATSAASSGGASSRYATAGRSSRTTFATASSDESNTDNNNDDDDDDDNNSTIRRRITPLARQQSSAKSTDVAEDSSAAAAAGETASGDDKQTSARNTGNRRSREFLPKAVNNLLDRSAQIRRDSQEQRSRGDSPQRSGERAQSSFYSPATSTESSSTATATRARLTSAYTNRDSTDSSATPAASYWPRKSSDERYSAADTARPSYRRDSSGDSGSGHSRFLMRSRTAAALSSSTRGSGDSLSRSQDQQQDSPAYTGAGSSTSGSYHSERRAAGDADSPRSYTTLSSRDRFMQSTAGLGSSSSPSSSTERSATRDSAASAAATPTSSGSTSAVRQYHQLSQQHQPTLSSMSLGQYGHHPSSRANYRDNSPFIEMDDEDDDDFASSSYFPSGYSSHSEYMRSKFASSHAAASASSVATSINKDSIDEPAIETDDRDAESNRSAASSVDSSAAALYRQRRASLRSSVAKSTTIDEEAASSSSDEVMSPETPYDRKGRVVLKLGSRGAEPGQFTWPRGVAVGRGFGSSSSSASTEVIVADSSNHRVQVFDLQSDGTFIREFGSYGCGDGEFDCLAGVALNRAHESYVVSDRYNHRVQLFDAHTGAFVRTFGSMGKAHEDGKLNLPWGVACDSDGLVYVCDKENHRVLVFDVRAGQDVRQVSSFGAAGAQPGQLQHPHYIAVGANKIVVTDTNNHRVQMFDPRSTTFVSSIGKEGSAQGEFKFPRGVAVDEHGYMIVGDSGNNRLQIFAPNGTFIRSIGTWGSGDAEFKGIEGVAVDSASYKILVCDRENHRIQIF